MLAAKSKRGKAADNGRGMPALPSRQLAPPAACGCIASTLVWGFAYITHCRDVCKTSEHAVPNTAPATMSLSHPSPLSSQTVCSQFCRRAMAQGDTGVMALQGAGVGST